MATLCLDFGNTRLKAAIFNDPSEPKIIHLENDHPSTIVSLIKEHKPDRSILSSVIDHDPEIETVLKQETKYHRLSSSTRLPFTIAVSKPESIGADRLALLAASVHYFPQRNSLIIGMGSCITYNFINQYDQFLGGSISPGMDMRFKAMHEFTAKLPLAVKPGEAGVPLVAYDTVTNLQSGVVYGMLCEIEGIINKYSEMYGNFNAVLTGGNSAYFARQLKKEIFADSNFLFKGLYALSELNNCGE